MIRIYICTGIKYIYNYCSFAERILMKILFRGKDLNEDNWIFGFLVISNSKYYIYNDQSNKAIEVIPDSVSQYIGKQDKNNKKIFIGDIIKYDNKKLLVKWSEGFAALILTDNGRFYEDFNYKSSDKYIIISNIWDETQESGDKHR
jgi:hypothetical protein